MRKDDREEALEVLIHDFARDLINGDDIILNLTTSSNCYAWGLDDYQDFRTWNAGEDKMFFSVVLVFLGDQDEEAPSPLDVIYATVEGKATWEDDRWVISNYKILDAEFDLDYAETADYVEAVTSNVDYYRTFSDEILSLRVLNTVHVPDPKALQALRRQTYIGAITCMETYLSDAFINNVLAREEFLESFFSNYDFGDRKVEMRRLYEYAKKVSDIAKNEMLEVRYHNLAKVSKIYKAVLKVEFPKFQEVAKAISMRHDLVHRNGKTKDGGDIHIDDDAVDAVIAEVENFVGEVNRRLEKVISAGQGGAAPEVEDIDDADIPF